MTLDPGRTQARADLEREMGPPLPKVGAYTRHRPGLSGCPRRSLVDGFSKSFVVARLTVVHRIRAVAGDGAEAGTSEALVVIFLSR